MPGVGVGVESPGLGPRAGSLWALSKNSGCRRRESQRLLGRSGALGSGPSRRAAGQRSPHLDEGPPPFLSFPGR